MNFDPNEPMNSDYWELSEDEIHGDDPPIDELDRLADEAGVPRYGEI